VVKCTTKNRRTRNINKQKHTRKYIGTVHNVLQKTCRRTLFFFWLRASSRICNTVYYAEN